MDTRKVWHCQACGKPGRIKGRERPEDKFKMRCSLCKDVFNQEDVTAVDVPVEFAPVHPCPICAKEGKDYGGGQRICSDRTCRHVF